MTARESTFVHLIHAASAQRPVVTVLETLTQHTAPWAAVLTPTGRTLASAARGAGRDVDPDLVAAAFAALPAPLSREYRGTGPDGTEVVAVPIRAESRPLAVLLATLDDPGLSDDLVVIESAALLMRMQWRYRRRTQVASRMVRDSVARLMFAGKLDSAFELSAEMGLAAPPTRPHVVALCGLAGWDTDDVLDQLENLLPAHARQILAYSDDDECWMLLTPAQFHAVRPELESLVGREPGLKVLLTEQVPASRMNHRWQHWGSHVRNSPDGSVVDRSTHRGDSPSDRVNKLRDTPAVLESVAAYLRHRGRWEPAAESLGVHRNTLRYRVASAEKTLGIDLTDPTVSSEVWLALVQEGLASH